jgi:TonB family protein
MTLRLAGPFALAGAAALLALGCASPGAAASGSAAPAACAPAAAPSDEAGLLAAFDSLHALRQGGRPAKRLLLAPYSRRPQLDNPQEVQQLMPRLYPPALRAARVTGRSEVAALIDASGTILTARAVHRSVHDDFDRAAVTAVQAMRFRPARRGGCPVPFFASIPITWTLGRGR